MSNFCEFTLHLLVVNGEVAPDEIVSSAGWMNVVETITCEAPATVTVMGERDSFGAEYLHFCEGCYPAFADELAAHHEAAKTGVCQWCKNKATDRREYRSWEDQPWETALVCGDCRDRDSAAQDEEIAYLDAQDAAYSARYNWAD